MKIKGMRILAAVMALTMVLGMLVVLPMSASAEDATAGGTAPYANSANPHEKKYGAYVMNKGVALPAGAEVWDGEYATGFSGGDGSAETPYQIVNAAQFMYFRDKVVAGDASATESASAYYELRGNVYLNDANYNSANMLTAPAGDFAGVFDGRGYAIYNAYTARGTATKYKAALFNTVSGTVKNFDAVGFDFITNGTYDIAGVALTLSGTIEGINVVGITVSQNSEALVNLSGIVAVCSGEATIRNCSVSGSITSKNKEISRSQAIAGIVAYTSASSLVVDACTNYATLVTSECEGNGATKVYSCSGIVGTTNGAALTIQNCVNYGKIMDVGTKANAPALAGILGYTYQKGFTITNCVNYGDIVAENSQPVAMGGIFGYQYVGGNPSFTNCTNYGDIVSPSAKNGNGGIAGRLHMSAYPTTCKNIFNYGSISVAGNASGFIGSLETTSKKPLKLYIYNSANYGAVQSTGDAAGSLIGTLNKSTGNAQSTEVYLYNCLVTGDVSAASYVGGVFGKIFEGATTATGSTKVELHTVYFGGTLSATSETGIAGVVGGDYTGTGAFSLTSDKAFNDMSVVINGAVQTAPNAYYNAMVGTTTNAPAQSSGVIMNGTAKTTLNTYAINNGYTPWIQTATAPEPVTNVGFSGATMSLDADASLNIKLSKDILAGINNISVKVQNIDTGIGVDAPIKKDYYTALDYYTASFTTYAADMAKPLNLRLIFSVGSADHVGSHILTYSPLDYLLATYEAYKEKDAGVADVAWKMMYYGAASEAKAYGTTSILATLNGKQISAPLFEDTYRDHVRTEITDNDYNAINQIAQTGADLFGNLRVAFKLKNTAYTTLTIQLNGIADQTVQAKDGYLFMTVNASMIRNTATLTFSGEGVTDVTAKFTVGNFLESRRQNASDEIEKMLVQATILYMMSARAYALGNEPPETDSGTITPPATNPDVGGESPSDPKPVVTHTVTFVDMDDTRLSVETVANSGTAKKPLDPVREGYTFTGWTLNGNAYDFSTPVTENITLKATYTEDETPVDPDTALDKDAAMFGSYRDVFQASSAILPRLTANGTVLKDANGKTVQLIGVNLGGWLVFEEWFCAVNDGLDARPGTTDDWLPKATGTEIYNALKTSYGATEAERLISLYQQNWITEYDLDYLQDIGINCVRVPFWYRNLQFEDGTWKTKTVNGKTVIDFDRLDWVVEECGKRGIYVILDLHGAPGFQNNAHHSGANNSMHLFDNNAAGEAYRQETISIWKAVATHFAGCGTVAGYDLLNEPYCDASINTTNIKNMYDRLYNAVRSVDTETVNIMEGIWDLYALPNPSTMGWTNIMYELHLYDSSESAVNSKATHIKNMSKSYNVPVYVGEFESGDYEQLAISSYAATGASLTTWTYKGISSEKQWFLRYATDRDKVNLKTDRSTVDDPSNSISTDSISEIEEKWGEILQTDYSKSGGLFGYGGTKVYSTNSNIVSWLQAALALAPQNQA